MIRLSKTQICKYIKTLNYDNEHKEKFLNNFDIKFFIESCKKNNISCIKEVSNANFIMFGFLWCNSIERKLYWNDYYTKLSEK
jgi:hypothetical protein